MTRNARLVPMEGYLHVMCRGNNRRKVFIKPCDCRFYLGLAAKYKREAGVKIIHYCLMPNHVHFMLGVKSESRLSRFMQRLNLSYFFHYQNKREYIGHLWQGRFKSTVVDTDRYFVQCGKYIELNPVRAGLSERPEDYMFSSFRYYAYGERDYLLDEDPAYCLFGDTPAERQDAYRDLVIDECVRGKMRFCNSRKSKELG